MKTGDIILVSGKSKQAKTIQKFQAKEDIHSAKWNHTGEILVLPSGIYVAEASYIQQRKVKAAIVLTPIDYYLNSDCELLLLEHDRPDLINAIEKEILKKVGTPYGYFHLLVVQPIQKLTGLFIGKKQNTDKRFICHEFAMTVWHNVAGYFSEHYKGNVKDIYHSKNFTHLKIK